MASWSIGIIGAGNVTQMRHLPVLKVASDVRVAWITDKVEARAQSLGRAYGVPSVALPDSPEELPGCDCVLLALPVGARSRYYPWLSRNVRGVLVEKPFARDVCEHKAIVDRFPPFAIACGYQRRMYSSSMLLRTITAEGWFGELVRVRIAEGGRVTRTGRDVTPLDDPGLASGGVLLELGCHTIDLALYVTGATDFEVISCNLVMDGHIDRRAQALVRLTKGGHRFDLHYCVSWLDHQPNSIEMQYEHATVSVGVKPGSPVHLAEAGRAKPQAGLLALRKGANTAHQAVLAEWSLFLHGLTDKRATALSAHECCLATALIENLYREGMHGHENSSPGC